ncbi:MAG: methyltransferase domain-containing protein [Bryobacteraceae bacterium]|nr:methyltransferase domain-containing protein [Bryobacteraceae bacterium]
MDLDGLLAALRSYQESRILLTAIELNLFTCVEGGATAEQVAQRMGGGPRATRMLLDALVSLGVLTKSGMKYSNTAMAAKYLTDSSAGNLRPSMLHDVHRWQTWSNLTGRIQGSIQPEQHSALEPERHRALLAMLDRKSVERAPKLLGAIGNAGVWRVLDLGGGSGAYSIAYARENEAVGAVVFELPQTAPITQEYIQRSGLQHRVKVRAGDFLSEDLGAGHDLILLFSITHLLGEKDNQDLLARCHRALAPAGRVAIHDHIMDADKTRPRAGAIFALNMLLATPGGGTYSDLEYGAWLGAAGFSAVERREVPGEPTALLIATR